MALIKCPECGKEISDKAGACPNCGCPISSLEGLAELSKQKEEEMKQTQSENRKTTIGIIIAVLIVAFIVGIGYYKSTELDRARAKLEKAKDNYNQTSKEIDDLQRQIDYNNYLIDEYEKNN